MFSDRRLRFDGKLSSSPNQSKSTCPNYRCHWLPTSLEIAGRQPGSGFLTKGLPPGVLRHKFVTHCHPERSKPCFLRLAESVILSITTSGLAGHTPSETLLRLLRPSPAVWFLRFFQKTCHVSNLTVAACGRTSHLFDRFRDHDSPVQTPSLIAGGGLPIQALGVLLLATE